ncbi:MAG: hypothetical protein WD738_14435 [Pirellulales bacterium]
MSTATFDLNHDRGATPAAAIVRRFVWKEYRMLRGLWLAVLVMGALAQWALSVLMPPSVDHATILFSTALAAAVLYAVGASAISFSVEHEEETYDFLAGLPTTWWPLFAGKLFVAAVSAFALAAVLSIIGWALCGFKSPRSNDTSIALAILGVAIIEGLAWGTFFSLLVKRPLLAAFLTLIIGAVAVNLAVNAASSYAVASAVPRAYVEAIPLRLAIVGAVLAGSVVLARRWLAVGTRTARAAHFRIADLFSFVRQKATAKLGSAAIISDRAARRTMLARLLWQTWRESWRLLLLPIAVAFVLFLGNSAIVFFLPGPNNLEIPLVTIASILFVPALYGAMAFSADQRRGSYRFLAEHAGRPRFVWLARHIVWLGALLITFVGFQLILAVVGATGLLYAAERATNQYTEWGQHIRRGAFEIAHYEQLQGALLAVRGAGLLWCGMFAAYAVGQLCSMLMRSEILAAFLALLLSVVLSAWLAVLFAWQLSGSLFLLPLAVGLMLATWLRAPDWITQRHAWHTWTFPALAILVPILMIGALLPFARLMQVPKVAIYDGQPAAVEAAIAAEVDSYLRGDTAEARETGELYIKAAENLAAGPKENFLARWETPGRLWTPGGLLESRIPADELDEFRQAEKEQLELNRASIAEAVAAVIEISKRPTCRFDFDVNMIAPNPRNERRDWSLDSYPLYEKLTRLQSYLLVADQISRRLYGDSDEIDKMTFFERAMASLRMSEHIRSGQPSVIFLDQLQREQVTLQGIGRWTMQQRRTKEELRNAIETLTGHFRTWPGLDAALIADHLLVRETLEGNQPPLVLAQSPTSPAVHLALLANALPWERERALRALDRITLQNIRDAGRLNDYLTSSTPIDVGTQYLRLWLRPLYYYYWDNLPASWQVKEHDSATSYLTRLEYQARVPIHELYRAYCDNFVCRRAALLQLALAMYRLDHGAYPRRLADLVPEYLDTLPLDPYSRQPFQYEPDGLDLPLERMSYMTNIERIASNTPLFWSVGSGNARLLWQVRTRFEDSEQDSDEDRIEIKETVYVFGSSDDPWYNDPAFAFPLQR